MENAFCTFIYGNYYRFIPYYLFSIKRSYPNTSVIILYSATLPKMYKELIDSYSNVNLFENVAKDATWLNDIRHRGAAKQTLRHVLKLDIFNKFKCIYFGDVDIIVLKEKYNLFDFHLKQAKKVSLPFSNRVRPMPDNSKKPSNRLTGLHLVVVKPYYEKMNSVIDKFISNKTYRNEILNKSERNENVLYYLCKEAFNFNPSQLLDNERPWHGFHLGLVRGKDYLNTQTLAENSSIRIENLKMQLSTLNQLGSIDQLLLKYKCVEVYHTYRYLNLKLGRRVKLKYLFSSKLKTLFHKLRKLKTKLKNA